MSMKFIFVRDAENSLKKDDIAVYCWHSVFQMLKLNVMNMIKLCHCLRIISWSSNDEVFCQVEILLIIRRSWDTFRMTTIDRFFKVVISTNQVFFWSIRGNIDRSLQNFHERSEGNFKQTEVNICPNLTRKTVN